MEDLDASMSLSLQNSFFQELASDTRHFLRRPGLAALTSVAVILILLFIVFPVGSVLLKSFTVTYPTVTVRCQSNVSNRADFEELVTRPILGAIGSIEGVE